VRASRLLQLLLLLQVRGRMTAPALAEALEVSVRTVYRDVEALSAAGVPVFTETGRNGGVSLLPGYGGADLDARAVLGAAAPALAGDIAERSLRDRLLVEPSGWWEPEEEVPHLPAVARAVWDEHLVRITYGGRDRVVTPLGVVVKGGAWYLLTADRTYRVARITGADVLPHPAERPSAFDLAAEWTARKEAFAASIPTYWVTVRVSPAGERLLGLLQEGTPPLPLPADVRRDGEGWAVLRLRFERMEPAGRLLLQLGGDVEVLRPAPLRRWMAREAARIATAYAV